MRSLLFLLLFIGLCANNSVAQDGTKWRGPMSNGIYIETGLLDQWPANGPQILWHFNKLGEGYSSPVFAGGKIYLTGMEKATGYLYCLSNEGKFLWKKPYGPEWHDSHPGTRTSPAIMGGRVYMLSGTGGLFCMDAGTGDIIWLKDLLKDFNGRNISWGMTENLIIYGDKVICTPGGVNHNVVALNRLNGKLIWSCKGKSELTAYCSPLLVKLPGRTLFVTMTANNILGIDANTGELLWTHKQTNTWSVHANTPIYSNGSLYCFSGYGRGGVKLKLNRDGSTVTKQWFNETLDSRIGGAVLVNGNIYGSGNENRTWQCIDWETGEQKFTSREIANGVVIYADGNLYCYSNRGELALMKPLQDSFKIISKTKVKYGSGPHWAHPVINDGKLYIRHGESLIAYKIK